MSLQHDGQILLNTRINHTDGHPPPMREGGDTVWNGRSQFWTVVRHTPSKDIWARSRHGAARVTHRVKYQLVATHIATGLSVKVTVWQCSRRAHSEIQVSERPHRPKDRCWLCSKI